MSGGGIARSQGTSGTRLLDRLSAGAGGVASEARRLKGLEVENARLKKLLTEAMLDMEALKVVVKGKP